MPSKAKRMQISVACYQFSSVSLSPWNYKSVVPTAPFLPGVAAGDNYVQEACRGGILRAVRKCDVDPSFKELVVLQTLEGVQADHRALLGSIPCTAISRVCEDQPKQEGGGLKKDERRSEPSPCKPSDSRHHNSNQNKIINSKSCENFKIMLTDI